MTPAPVLVELLRRGDLTLTRSTVTDRVGLLRDELGTPAAEAERAGKAAAAAPEQATLVIDA